MSGNVPSMLTIAWRQLTGRRCPSVHVPWGSTEQIRCVHVRGHELRRDPIMHGGPEGLFGWGHWK